MSVPVIAAIAAAVAFAVGYFVRQSVVSKGASSLEERARRLVAEAEVRAKEIAAEAKERAASLVLQGEKEERERKAQLAAAEGHLMKREEAFEKKSALVAEDERAVKVQQEKLDERARDVEKIATEAEGRLEKVAGLSVAEAKDALLKQVRERHAEELALALQKLMKERRDEVEKQSLAILTIALQRYARSHVSELTTTTFHLHDEDIKGKIIGREGRNIRALEAATGVEFMLDETPDTVIISSFDPYRREVARLALEKLVKDGRIQPAKIEEKVEEAKQELQKRIMEIGESAALDVGIFDLPKEIIQLLGRLHFRTSFGQNVLTHSTEMAYVAGMIAAELGLNVTVAKKGALLHDIGKAIDHEVEGTHVELGRKILKKYEIEEAVIQAMQSHHDDYPYEIPEAYVVTAADILSAGRPGARRGTMENYVKRLGDLEKIAMEFPGVKSAYAISAGRELRVFVIPEKIDDFRALEMAREIANRIQSELKYPGEIKVNVIREMRAVEYAR